MIVQILMNSTFYTPYEHYSTEFTSHKYLNRHVIFVA